MPSCGTVIRSNEEGQSFIRHFSAGVGLGLLMEVKRSVHLIIACILY